MLIPNPPQLDLVRLYITDDTDDPEKQLFSDARITDVWDDQGGSLARTVATLLRVIAASEALVSKKISTQDLSTDGPAVAAELRAQAKEWDARADAEDAAADEDAAPFAGYIGGPGRRHEAEEHRPWWG